MAEGRPQTESCADARQKKGTVGDYAQLRPLGEGSFSVVYECLQLSTGRRVAVKRFKDEHVDPLTRRLALRELRVLRALPAHPNVVTLLDAFRSSSGRLYMTFELLGASLVQEMHCHPRGRLPPSLLRCVAWQLLGALEHCHAHGVVHRDVKPANVLVDNVAGAAAGETAAVVKLCDFGLARWLPGREPLASGEGCHVSRSNRPGAPMTEYVVTRWYRAPELLVGNNQYDTAVDIWSFGCLMAELATGRPLFYGASESDQLWHIVRCLGPLPYGTRSLTSSSRQAGGLMKGADATSRPAAGSGGGGGTGHGGGGTAAHGYRGLAQRLGSAAEPTMLQLVGLCLALDPAARPTAAQLRQLPYFGGGLGQAPRPAPSPRPQPSAEVPPQPAPSWPLSAPARPVVVLPSSQPNPPPAAAAAAPAAPAVPAAAAATSSSLPAPAPAAGAGDQLPRARASANTALASAPGAVTAAASAAVSGGGGSADCGPRVLLGDGVERGQLSISMSASGHVRGMGAAALGVTADEVWHAASQIQSGATDAAVGDVKGPEEGQGADGGLASASASAETSAEAPRQVRQARPNGSAAVAVAAAAALTAPPSPQRLLMRYAISSPQPGVPYASQPHGTSATAPDASAAAAAASQRRLAEASDTSAAVDSAASGGLLSGAALSPLPPLPPPAPKRRGAEGRARRSEGGWGSRGVSRIVQAIGGLLPLSRRGAAGADSIGGIERVGSPVALGAAASTGTSAAGPAAAAAAAGRRLGGTQPRGLFNRSSLPAGPPRACTTDQAFSRPSLDSIAPRGMGAGGGGGTAAALRSRAATAVAAATASAAAASVETMSGSMRSAMAAFLDGEDGPTGHPAAAPAAGGGGSGGGEYGTSVVPSRSLHGVLMEEDEPAENGEDVWEDLNATGMRMLRSSSQSVHRQRAGRAPRTVSRGMSAGGGSRSGPAASAADAAAVAAQGWVAVVSGNPAAAAAPASVSQPGGLAALAAAATAAAQSASAGGGRQTRSSLAAAVSRMLNVVSGGAGGGGGDDGDDEGRTSRLRRMAYVKSNSSVTDTEEPIAADSRWHPGESVAAGVWGSGSAGMEPGAPGHLAAAGPPTAVFGRSSLASVHEMEVELVEAAPAPADEGRGAPLGVEEGGRVDGGGGGGARRGFGRGLAKALARRVKKALGSGS